MLGREKEQEKLRAVIRELKVDRRGQMIAITGEAGYGKSCLVNVIIMECNQQQVPVGLLVAEDGIEVSVSLGLSVCTTPCLHTCLFISAAYIMHQLHCTRHFTTLSILVPNMSLIPHILPNHFPPLSPSSLLLRVRILTHTNQRVPFHIVGKLVTVLVDDTESVADELNSDVVNTICADGHYANQQVRDAYLALVGTIEFFNQDDGMQSKESRVRRRTSEAQRFSPQLINAVLSCLLIKLCKYARVDVLCIDNMQFLDEGSLNFVCNLVRNLAATQRVALVASRSMQANAACAGSFNALLCDTTHMTLDGFGGDNARQLVCHHIQRTVAAGVHDRLRQGGEPFKLPEDELQEAVERILNDALGNPLWLTEMAKG